MKKSIVKIVTTLAVVALLVAVLVACVPTDYKKAEKNLEDADYIVTTDSSIDRFEAESLGLEDVEHIVSAFNMDDDYITLYYFKSESAAKEALDKIKDDADSDAKVERSGKVVYAGTKQAIKDVK